MIDMCKIFKPRNMRRGLLLALLFAPLVYLFGTQFHALNGAHGEEVLATDDYSSKWVQSDNFDIGSDFKFVFDKEFSTSTAFSYNFTFWVSHDLFVDSFGYMNWNGTRMIFTFSSVDNTGITPYRSSIGWSSYPSYATIYFSSSSLPSVSLLSFGTLYYFDSSVVSSYSDSLFGNFFNPNNWVSQLGKQVMRDDAIGFAPVGELMRFTDDNMLHIKDTPWGDLAYGYAYYAINVFLLYEVVCLSMFVIALPFKIIDILEKKTGGDL